MVQGFASSVGGLFKQAFAFAGGQLIANQVQSIFGRLKGMVMQGIAMNAQFEGLNASFEIMLGSASKAKKLIEEIRDFAARTPFEMPTLASGAQSLLATREIAEDQLLPTLRKLGDAAAGSAEGFASFPRIVRAVTQMLGKGKVTGEEMLQLAEAGIPAWSALADKMGVSVAEVQKLSQKGKLGADAVRILIDALGDRFAGMADKQSKTFAGLRSTITDNFNMAIAQITGPIFNRIKPAMERIVSWFDTAGFQVVIDKITAGVEWVVSAIETGLKSPIVQAVLAFGGMVAAALATGAALAVVVPMIGGILATLWQIMVPVLAISAAFAGLGMLIRNAFAGPEGGKYVAMLRESWALIQVIGANIRTNLLPVWNQLVAIGSSWGAKIQTGFNSFLGAALSGMRTLIEWIAILSNNFTLAWEFIKTKAAETALFIVESFEYALNVQIPTAMSAMWDAMGAGLVVLGRNFKTIFEAVIQFFQGAVMAIWDSMAERFSALVEAAQLVYEGKPGTAARRFVEGNVQATGTLASGLAKAGVQFAKDLSPVAQEMGVEIRKAIKDAYAGMPEFQPSNELKRLSGMTDQQWEVMQRRHKEDMALRAAGSGAGAPTPEQAKAEEEKKAEDKKKAADEAKKKDRKAEFIGIAELNKRIQTSLTSNDAKNAKAAVKAAQEGAAAAKEAVVLQREEIAIDTKILDNLAKLGFDT